MKQAARRRRLAGGGGRAGAPSPPEGASGEAFEEPERGSSEPERRSPEPERELTEPELDPNSGISPARFDWALHRLRREIPEQRDDASR